MKTRVSWAELPRSVRAGVERILGETVVTAQSQTGGFSPGSADRVVLASGRRAFVKAVSAESNATSPVLHRREAAVAKALPPGIPAPKFLGMYDDGTWVALVLDDVSGTHPREPWQESELLHVLDRLADIGCVELPADVPLPQYEDSLRGAFRGWEKLASRPMAGMPAWEAEHLGLLAGLAKEGVEALAGGSLVHGDLRTDNIMLTDSGPVLLDWPWAAVGAPWADALSVLINATTLDPLSGWDHVLKEHRVFAAASDAGVTGVLAGWAGYFLDMSRRPAPPGIPTLRAFQARQAEVITGWLRKRLS
ncbi:phosphotransferase family protein [Arthrobacter sp.]|uniref:phosphotransferase family protein n=1 Tax=Arthrobacter sp. TaxID=1667 RepID=UPI0026DF1AA3|nr:phosphotransferase [Arthrobacter sp.]MDO5753028.1 phosphotransferase [Arthrobacter sp.]